MYAIAFDMIVSDLRQHYGEPYNNAYFEINQVLRKYNLQYPGKCLYDGKYRYVQSLPGNRRIKAY